MFANFGALQTFESIRPEQDKLMNAGDTNRLDLSADTKQLAYADFNLFVFVFLYRSGENYFKDAVIGFF